MNHSTKLYPHLTILLVGLVILTACQTSSPIVGTTPTAQPAAATATVNLPTQTSAPTAGPTLAPTANLPTLSAKISLDPALAQDADSLKICQSLYEGLVRRGADGKPEPALATSWVISEDELDYIFKLRSNATFSDGTAITPEVVVANFNRWFDTENSLHGKNDFAAWLSVFKGYHGEKDANNRAKSYLDGVQNIDQNTVLIHLSRPFPDMLSALTRPEFAILKPDALASGKYGGRDSKVISSGAYLVSAWTETSLTLSPNPKYWGTAAKEDLRFNLK